MTDVIFDGFNEYISSALFAAEVDVKIAVAWLNFKMYGGYLRHCFKGECIWKSLLMMIC